jgi:hypothetical protein
MVLIHHSPEQEEKFVLQALSTSHVSIYMNFMSKNFAVWNIFLLFKVFPPVFTYQRKGELFTLTSSIIVNITLFPFPTRFPRSKDV